MTPVQPGVSVGAIGPTLLYAGNNHWGGLSGWLPVSDGADATLFDFRSELKIALKVELYYSFDYDELGTDKFWGMEIKINGQTVLKPRASATAAQKIHGMPLENHVKFIVFPRDHVVILGQCEDDATFCGGTIVARGLSSGAE